MLFISTLASAVDLTALLNTYRGIQADLAYDRYSETRRGATDLLPVLDRWISELPASDSALAPLRRMREGAQLLSETSDEAQQRRRFGVFAEGACRLIKLNPSVSARWQLYKCTMVDWYPYWAQPIGETMANPYMGTSMLQCGIRKAWTALP